MEADRIITQGNIAKFRIAITHDGFDQQVDAFRVCLRWGIPQRYLIIDREDMLHDEDGNFYLVFPSSGMQGQLLAECHYGVHDEDVEGDVRDDVDRQWLAFVTDSPCPHFAGRCDCFGSRDGHVEYERTDDSDVASIYMTLVTSDGQTVTDANGAILKVRRK